MRIETDVLIIGGGVAGSAMASSLANKGYRVTLLEKSEKPQDTARGDHLQPYVCEILNPVSYTHLTLPTICSV